MSILEKQEVRIKLKGYTSSTLDSCVKDIVKAIKRWAVLRGPIPLPNCKKKFTVLASPNGDKDARDQYEICEHTRLIVVMNPTDEAMQALVRVKLLPGVSIQIQT